MQSTGKTSQVPAQRWNPSKQFLSVQHSCQESLFRLLQTTSGEILRHSAILPSQLPQPILPILSGATGTLGMKARQLCLCYFAQPFSRRFTSMVAKFYHNTTDRASTLIPTLQQKGTEQQELNWPPKVINHVSGTAQALLTWQAVHSFSVSHRAQKSSRPETCLSPLVWTCGTKTHYILGKGQLYGAQETLCACMYLQTSISVQHASVEKNCCCIQHHCISIKCVLVKRVLVASPFTSHSHSCSINRVFFIIGHIF